jgi:hypothetical protein
MILPQYEDFACGEAPTLPFGLVTEVPADAALTFTLRLPGGDVVKTTAGGDITVDGSQTVTRNGVECWQAGVAFAASDTADEPPGVYNWDLWRTDAGSERQLMYGKIRLRPGVPGAGSADALLLEDGGLLLEE